MKEAIFLISQTHYKSLRWYLPRVESVFQNQENTVFKSSELAIQFGKGVYT